MKILVTGSSGLMGSALVDALESEGDEAVRLVRSRDGMSGTRSAFWDPAAGRIDAAGLEGVDAVVHLAGENIAAGKWTRQKKARIQDSRIGGTRLLSEALAALKHPPRVFFCASAIGYYGDRGDEVLDEKSPAGEGFLAETCREWESATGPAAGKGIRVVLLRFGVVLSARGGALAKMLGPFRWGLGGPIGDGRQFISWVALEDAIAAIRHAIGHEKLSGAVNVVSPYPVRNITFARTLGRVLRRPTVFSLPAFAARLTLGEMADALLLSSTRVAPKRLQAAGFEYRFPHLESALRHSLM